MTNFCCYQHQRCLRRPIRCAGHDTKNDPDTSKPYPCPHWVCEVHGRLIDAAPSRLLCPGCAHRAARVFRDIEARIATLGEPLPMATLPESGEYWPSIPGGRPYLLMENKRSFAWIVYPSEGIAWRCPVGADLRWELEKLPGVIDLA